MAYAEGTTTPPEKSQMEIAGAVRKYGAASFATGWDGPRALVTFVAHDRQIRFVLDLPTDWRDFVLTPSKQRRTEPFEKAIADGQMPTTLLAIEGQR